MKPGDTIYWCDYHGFCMTFTVKELLTVTGFVIVNPHNVRLDVRDVSDTPEGAMQRKIQHLDREIKAEEKKRQQLVAALEFVECLRGTQQTQTCLRVQSLGRIKSAAKAGLAANQPKTGNTRQSLPRGQPPGA